MMTSPRSKVPAQRAAFPLQPIVVAALIAVLGLVMAVAAATWVERRNAELAQISFDTLAARVARQIDERLAKYEYAVRGARGAIVAASRTGLTAQDFRDYGRTRDIKREFPGLRGFGYIERVAPGDVAAFVARRRADGFPDFAIKQIRRHADELFVIRYVEPIAPNRVAIGLDVASETARRAAAVRAMRTGKASLTAPIRLIQVQGGGFLLFLPVYRAGAAIATAEQRSRALTGWSYAPLSITEVLSGFDAGQHEYDVAIRDLAAPGARPFFTTMREGSAATTLRRDVGIGPFGRAWRVRVIARPDFVANLRQPSPWTTGGITFLLSLIPAGLAWVMLANAQRRRSAGMGKARLAAIVSGSEDAIIATALDGMVTDWNPAAERLFGIAAAAAIGRRVADLIVPPDRLEEEAALLTRAGRGEATPALTTRRRRRDGSEIPVQIVVSPIRTARGQVVGVATTVRDITEQEAAERAIRELNATLEQQVTERTAQLRASTVLQSAILNYAGYAVIATDAAGTITLFNPAAEKMLGYAADELVGKASPAVFHDPDEVAERAAELSAEFGETVAPGFGTFVYRTDRGLTNLSTWTYVHKAGDRFRVQLNISPIRTDDGEELGYLGIAVDLTDQLRREAELEEARGNAEEAAAAKAEFLATMSHELRTPLNSVIGFSRLMLDGGELTSPAAERQARLIHEASRTLLSVVNDVLDVSKLDSGRLDLDPRPFSLRHLIEGTIDMLRAQALEKGLTIDAVWPADLPPMLVGDEARLRQVLLNLLSNAVKFTAQGGIRVRVEESAVRGDHAALRISVTDTGIGIAETKRHRIFARFSQADGSTSREYGGTGLGLAISRSLIEMMGGTIDFVSEEGRGSTFWIALELPVATAGPVTTVAPDSDLPPRDTPLSILLAEDVEINQELAVAFITRWGHKVDVVSDGAAAVAAVQQGDYDLVLMDVQMPVMDGLEATQRIRASAAAYARIPIIAMTANVLPDDLARFHAAGMDDHVGKPFDPAELYRAIERWAPADGDAAVGQARGGAPAPQKAGGGPNATLAEKYQARRAATADTLSTLRPALDRAPPADDALREMKAVVHQLSGIAGMFGETRVGDLAGTAEVSMDQLIATPADGAAQADARRDLDALLRALARR